MTAKKEIKVNPKPLFELSPWLYMQFMEPLGTTDSSVDSAWDYKHDKWMDDFVVKSKELAPGLMRWGGIISAYTRWREGIGPRESRVPMLNLLWGGVESNQIGTAEFCEFCEMINADKLMCVNFWSDGQEEYKKTPQGDIRTAGPQEAAEWVDYCNNPDNSERIAHGRRKPFDIKLWQLGNETSYDYPGEPFTLDETIKYTKEFSDAIRNVDPDVKFLGWGDSGWAPRLLQEAGDKFDYVAFHHHFGSGMEPTVLKENDYRKDWDRTWEELMNARISTEKKIEEMRQQVAGFDHKLAMTESHFGLKGRNRCEVLSSWAAGVANARILNVHERNGDLLKIATLADFCGTRWMVNAIYINNRTDCHLMPVGHVMSLFRRHIGKHEIEVLNAPEGLDITASMDSDKIYLHVVNTNKNTGVKAPISIKGLKAAKGKVFELSADPEWEIMRTNYSEFGVKEKDMARCGEWYFPAASVSAVELEIGS